MLLRQLQAALADPDIEYWPELRWWLASGLHTERTLLNEIKTAHTLGFGGMEFLAMPEPNIDEARYAWGSEEWSNTSMLVVEELTRRRMAVSLTSGTNWANANVPTIHPDHVAAARELDYVYEDVTHRRSGPIPRIDLDNFNTRPSQFETKHEVLKQSFEACVAARLTEDGTLGDTQVLEVTDGDLEWDAGGQTWRIFYFYSHGTGQIAEPSSSVNYTVNYLVPEGAAEVISYWRDTILTAEMRNAISRNPRVQMYMDSLELVATGDGGLFWGHTVVGEFERRRGYSILPYLPFMLRKVPVFACSATYLYESRSDTRIDKVRFDLAKTFTDLYIDNMLAPLSAFLHSNGMGLRAEISYGCPFELTRPAQYVDGLETESLEFAAQIDAYRLMGGAAHLLGKQYSCETGATSRNFMLPHRFYDQIISTQLAAGITKTVLHGWASMAGAPGTEWPGHEGMWAMWSERFDSRQPSSEFYPFWTKSLAQRQFLLRQGQPRIDVGIIRTDHATDNLIMGAMRDVDGFRAGEEEVYGKWWMRNRQNLWWSDMGLQDAGWTYEFFDGSLLTEAMFNEDGSVGIPGYQALIVYQDTLDPDVALLLLRLSRRGLPVLLVHDTTEVTYLAGGKFKSHKRAASATPGLDGRDSELSATIAEILSLPNGKEIDNPSRTLDALRKLGVAGRAEFVQPNPNILSHLRQDGDLYHLYVYHYLYETGQPTTIGVSLDGSPVELIAGALRQTQGVTWVDLVPGESKIITFSPEEPEKIRRADFVATLDDWSLRVESWDAGEIEVITEDRGKGYVTEEHLPSPKKTMIEVGKTALKPWCQLEAVGPEVSGIGEYRMTVHAEAGGEYQLHLGSTGGGLGSITVNDSAPLGFDTSALRIGISLHAGENSIVVRVASSLNNRLIARDYYKPGPEVAEGVLGKWRTDGLVVREYGLLGPVTLYKLRL